MSPAASFAAGPLLRSALLPRPARLPFSLPALLRGARPARRFQSSPAGPAAGSTGSAGSAGPPPPSWFQRMWNSPIGLKTVHFWAPVMKWCLVIAGLADFARPVEKLSIPQNIALTATGLIWTRWCLIIKPKNYLLAAVNFFLGSVGVVQVARIGLHKRQHPTEDAAYDLISKGTQAATDAVAAVQDKVKAA